MNSKDKQKDIITEYSNFDYTLENNTITLNIYRSDKEIVNIPETYKIDGKKYNVTTIDRYCFYNNDTIEKVILPDTITGIEPNSFSCCENLKSIKLPDKITTIPESCFELCTNLESIEIPDSVVKIEEGAFASSNLKKIKLPNNIKTIGKECFWGCEELEEIEFPQNLEIIEEYAFQDCKKLKKIILPDNIKTIEKYTFNNCRNLKKINIPNNIKEIDQGVFCNCDQLELEDFENQYIKIENNNIYQKVIENNKTIYYLTNCHQKQNTLKLKGNKKLKYLNNIKVKNVIINDTILENHVIEQDNIHTLILPKINTISEQTIFAKINNIFLSNNIKELYINGYINNLYFNGKKEYFKEKIYCDIYYKNLIYKKEINELLKDGYNFKQIDLIIKGYDKNILLSNVNKNIDEHILRAIIENFNYDDFELYNILELLQEEINLENKIKIQEIIKNNTSNKESIKMNIDLEK